MIDCYRCGQVFRVQTDSYTCPMCGASSYPDDEDVLGDEPDGRGSECSTADMPVVIVECDE